MLFSNIAIDYFVAITDPLCLIIDSENRTRLQIQDLCLVCCSRLNKTIRVGIARSIICTHAKCVYSRFIRQSKDDRLGNCQTKWHRFVKKFVQLSVCISLNGLYVQHCPTLCKQHGARIGLHLKLDTKNNARNKRSEKKNGKKTS